MMFDFEDRYVHQAIVSKRFPSAVYTFIWFCFIPSLPHRPFCLKDICCQFARRLKVSVPSHGVSKLKKRTILSQSVESKLYYTSLPPRVLPFFPSWIFLPPVNDFSTFFLCFHLSFLSGDAVFDSAQFIHHPH